RILRRRLSPRARPVDHSSTAYRQKGTPRRGRFSERVIQQVQVQRLNLQWNVETSLRRGIPDKTNTGVLISIEKLRSDVLRSEKIDASFIDFPGVQLQDAVDRCRGLRGADCKGFLGRICTTNRYAQLCTLHAESLRE